MNKDIKALLLAISLLTRFPVPQLVDLRPQDAGRSALFYPLVGLLIGGVLCLPLLIFPYASAWLLAAVLTVLWAVVTGGLHLDGLADSADGWLGGAGDRECTQRIMKDPLVGAAGVIAIVSVMMLKYVSLALVISQAGWIGVLLAPVLGRSMILLLFLTTTYIRSDGMASSVIEYLPKRPAIMLTGASYLLCITFSLSGMLFALFGFFALRQLMLKRLDGCTGDTAGALVEITEMLWLLGIALALRQV